MVGPLPLQIQTLLDLMVTFTCLPIEENRHSSSEKSHRLAANAHGKVTCKYPLFKAVPVRSITSAE
jgi:hypothetical protein